MVYVMVKNFVINSNSVHVFNMVLAKINAQDGSMLWMKSVFQDFESIGNLYMSHKTKTSDAT